MLLPAGPTNFEFIDAFDNLKIVDHPGQQSGMAILNCIRLTDDDAKTQGRRTIGWKKAEATGGTVTRGG